MLDFPPAARALWAGGCCPGTAGVPAARPLGAPPMPRSQPAWPSGGLGATPLLTCTRSLGGASPLLRETGSADAVSHLSRRRMAQWVRHGREGQQSGDANTAQRGSRCGSAPTHVNPMLALRTALCNDRWDEAWQQVRIMQRQRRLSRRLQRASARRMALMSVLLLALVRVRPDLALPFASLPRHSPPPATLPGSSRPSPHHPWKRLPACRPTLAAKI